MRRIMNANKLLLACAVVILSLCVPIGSARGADDCPPTDTPTAEADTPTPKPSWTPKPTDTPDPTFTRTVEPTATHTVEPTATRTQRPTRTPMPTETDKPTITGTRDYFPTNTVEPTPTAGDTATATVTEGAYPEPGHPAPVETLPVTGGGSSRLDLLAVWGVVLFGVAFLARVMRRSV